MYPVLNSLYCYNKITVNDSAFPYLGVRFPYLYLKYKYKNSKHKNRNTSYIGKQVLVSIIGNHEVVSADDILAIL